MRKHLLYWVCHMISMFAGCTTIIAFGAILMTVPVYCVLGNDGWSSSLYGFPEGPIATWTLSWLVTAVLFKSGRITYISGYEKYL